jgi:hypothetical protein
MTGWIGQEEKPMRKKETEIALADLRRMAAQAGYQNPIAFIEAVRRGTDAVAVRIWLDYCAEIDSLEAMLHPDRRA